MGKKRRATSGLCVAVSEDVRAIRQLIDRVVRTGELPLSGNDSPRVREALQEREDTWPRGRRREEVGRRAIDWCRRLVVAELFARPTGLPAIARSVEADSEVVQDDLSVVSAYRTLALGLGQADAALSRTRRRIERLQVDAFQNLAEAGGLEPRRRIRNEITDREVKLCELLMKLGFLGPIGRSLREGESDAERGVRDPAGPPPGTGKPYQGQEYIAAISQLTEAVVYPDELPVYGAGSVRVLKILQQGGDKWTAGRKERGSDEHMAVWARRLLVAAQLAEGVGPAHIAASDVDRSVVYNDIRALNEHGLLMPGREPAKDVIAKILIRLEYLQRAAFEDLIDAEEAEALLRLRIRVEIEKRELATFEILKELGIFDSLGWHQENPSVLRGPRCSAGRTQTFKVGACTYRVNYIPFKEQEA